MGSRLSPEAQELAARIVCTVRDEGVNAASRLISGLTETQHMMLTLTLAGCVPDDEPLRSFTPKAIASEEAAQNCRTLAEALADRHRDRRAAKRHRVAA